MQQVVESGTRVARVIAEIESASREQAAGIEQINKAMAKMDELTQRDAQMAQELISTAETLQSQSDQMLAAISAFSMQRYDARDAQFKPADRAASHMPTARAPDPIFTSIFRAARPLRRPVSHDRGASAPPSIETTLPGTAFA